MCDFEWDMSVTTLIEGSKYRVEVSGGPGKTGKPARITRIVYGTEDEARAVEADLKARKNALAALGRNPTLADYVQSYIDDRSELYDPVAPKTLDLWRGILRTNVRPYWKDRYLMDVRAADLRAFYRWLMGTRKLSGETVRKTHALLRLVFKQAVEDEMISTSPLNSIKAPPSDTKPKRTLSDDDVAALLTETYGTDVHLPALLALETAMRRGEVLALTWANLDFDSLMVKVAASIDTITNEPKAPKTSAGTRTVPITKPLAVELKAHRARLAEMRLKVPDRWTDRGLVFPSTSMVGGRHAGEVWLPTTFANQWQRVAQGWHFHELRHTAIDRWRRNGISLEVAQYMAGHATPNVLLEVYRHVGVDEVEAVRALMV